MAEAKRDRWKRYLLPHPESGREVPWTRCTTLTKTLDDQTGINKWRMRGVVLGIAARADLYALALASDPDDKKQIDGLCEQAIEASKASAASNLGTAIHRFTERVDSGKAPAAPDVFGGDISAYQSELNAQKVMMSAQLIERVTVVPELAVAGTMDRIATVGGKQYIADLKTGQNLNPAWMSIAMQLGVYSRGHGLWDPEREVYDPMPDVDQNNGIVIHLPAGRGECTLYWVDIAAGWEAAKVAYMVRAWRQRRDWALPFGQERKAA